MIVLEHTAIAKTVNVAMESMIGRQREALIRLGPYSIANYLFTNYYETAINADIFKDWVFILDNASFQKRKDIKEAIISAGHSLFFQLIYSPDLNKVENK